MLGMRNGGGLAGALALAVACAAAGADALPLRNPQVVFATAPLQSFM